MSHDISAARELLSGRPTRQSRDPCVSVRMRRAAGGNGSAHEMKKWDEISKRHVAQRDRRPRDQSVVGNVTICQTVLAALCRDYPTNPFWKLILFIIFFLTKLEW